MTTIMIEHEASATTAITGVTTTTTMITITTTIINKNNDINDNYFLNYF